jgi:hypothetical protein
VITVGAPRRLIDVDAARGFPAALAPGEDRFTFQTFDGAATDRPGLARVMHGALDDKSAELARLSALGAGAFVTVNRTDLRGRCEANVIGARALFVDLDGAPLSVLDRFNLPPHIIVITNPGRFHV